MNWMKESQKKFTYTMEPISFTQNLKKEESILTNTLTGEQAPLLSQFCIRSRALNNLSTIFIIHGLKCHIWFRGYDLKHSLTCRYWGNWKWEKWTKKWYLIEKSNKKNQKYFQELSKNIHFDFSLCFHFCFNIVQLLTLHHVVIFHAFSFFGSI